MKVIHSFKSKIAIILLFLFSQTADGITLHLKPNAAVGKDAYLADNSPNSSFPNHDELSAIAWTCGGNCNGRGVLQFDISSIPIGAVITSAQMSLFAYPNPQNGNGIAMQGNNQALLQRITGAWSENTVTWNNVPSITTQNQVVLAQSTSTTQNYLNINVTNIVQDMVNDPTHSFGFLFRLTNEVHYASMTFASSDFSDPTKWPEITIEYQSSSTFTTNAFTQTSFCVGSNSSVGFTSNVSFNANNIFTAQLSNASGSFASPLNIGTLAGTTSGNIQVTYPSNTPFGSGYRVRVISSSPSFISTDNGANILFPNPNDTNFCTIDGCDIATGLVSHITVNTDDNNGCTNDACIPSTGLITHTRVDTSDNNACTIDACIPATGVITHTPINLNDNNACTDDVCAPATGVITHPPTNRDDNNLCTSDLCDPAVGVFHVAISTTDNNICTEDVCTPSTGIITHPSVNVDDNNLCTTDICDPASGILHFPINISDNDPCTEDACDPLTGNFNYKPVLTDDNNVCTNDACVPTTGAIIHTPVNINDNNACTFDGCDYLTGVFHNPTNINDQNQCTIDACDPATGSISHTAVSVNDNNPCTVDGCDLLNGIYHTPVVINDNNACTIDACNPSTGAVSHTPVNTNDNNVCTFDGCDFITGVYHNAPNIDDQNICTEDACNPSTGVTTHHLINTNDNNECTVDGCDYTSGVYHNAPNIDDQNICTEDACNPSTGIVTHHPINTNDNNECTVDGCDYTTGVYHNTTISDDGNVCTNDACDPSTGIVSHNPVVTDDNNLCTFDGCDYVTGVFHYMVNTDDGNACTIDACDPLTADISHSQLNADDHNLCTFDGCDPFMGEYHNPISTEDNNSCTTDGCDPVTGIYHTPVDINDNNECTVDECDPATGSISHAATNVDDANPCTIDQCDIATGAITHTNNAPVVTSTYDPIVCYGETTCVTLVATGGLPPYSGDGLQCGFDGGAWTFDIQDNSGCLVSHVVNILQPEKLNLELTSLPANCMGNNGVASVNPTGGSTPYNYLWSPGNEITQTITGLSSGPYSVQVTDGNGCTIAGTTTVQTNGNFPGATGIINGPFGACRTQTGVVYSVPPVANASTYIWTLPSGVSGSSSTNSISLSFSNSFSGGIICVKASNSCGDGPNSCKNISRIKNKPDNLAKIIGSSNVCVGSQATYCVPSAANATSYIWSISGNGGSSPLTIISGQGTSCVVLNIPAGYNGNQKLKVKASNCIGTTPTQDKNIHKTNVPNTPNSISGSSLVCLSQTAAYSIGNVSGATSYLWTISGGATIVSGQGTKNIAVNFASSTSTSAVLTFVAVNACGSSAPSTKTITINLNCRVAPRPYVSESFDASDNVISAYPNPTSGLISVSFSSSGSENIRLTVYDLSGRLVKLMQLDAVPGNNNIELDLSSVQQGVYLLNIEGKELGKDILKIVVE